MTGLRLGLSVSAALFETTMTRFAIKCWPPGMVAFVVVALLASWPARAHELAPAATHKPSHVGSALSLSEAPAPLSARYRVKVSLKAKPMRPAVHQVWFFQRDATQVALLKGSIDEVWHRDPQRLVSFERVFHDDQRVVDYSAGELATLNISTDWAALSSFVDPQVLRGLRVVSRQGSGAGERLLLAGSVGGDVYRVDWRPTLQLPERMLRTERDGRMTEFVLDQHAATAPAGWPAPGARSADYLRLDAADFGDMDYEAVVRKSEALDIRLGWRSAHLHD